MFGFGKKKTLQEFDKSLSRERLVQGGRIVVIDDEVPLLIEELRSRGFSVDHDLDGTNLDKYEKQLYDVAIVDYHGVGQKLGKAQGLEVLRYIKRVSPRTRLIAYTSKSLSAAESEFFRSSHSVLPKDFGLNDSMLHIEDELRKALAKEHLFQALLDKINLTDNAQREQVKETLIKALGKKNEGMFKEVVAKAAGKGAEKVVELIIDKLFL